MNEVLITSIGSVVSILTAFFGYKAGQRKTDAVAQKSEISNVEDAIKIWRELANDFANKLKISQDELAKIYEQYVAIKSQNHSLMKQISKLQKDVELLTKQQ